MTAPSHSPQARYILRTAAAQLPQIAAAHGLTVLDTTEYPEGHLAHVEAPATLSPELFEQALMADPGVEDLSSASLAMLPVDHGVLGIDAATAPSLDNLLLDGLATTSCLQHYLPEAPWSGYAAQSAVDQIHLAEAHQISNCGAGTVVAILDTGVDPSHPLLAGALVPGYDFLTGQSGLASEWAGLRQSVSAILEQSVSAILEEQMTTVVAGQGQPVWLDASITPVVGQASVATLEGQELPRFFGHGTMVAGIVRLTAPGARIMPMRVFNSDGTASLYDIVSAIYLAVDQGADVISMSFSMEDSAPELRRAIRYARRNGVACVAAAGNDASRTQVYPASLSAAVGVASVNEDDQLSEFSNYGPFLVTVAAPGSGVISSYPGGLYAAGWGTSFSTPFVTGTLALLQEMVRHECRTARVQELVRAIRDGSQPLPDLGEEVGSGRLDAFSALLEALD